MNKKVLSSFNKTKEKYIFKNQVKHKKKEINLHIVRYIKGHLKVESLMEVPMSNILNLKVKDIEAIEIGNRELSLKDITIICNSYKINPDHIFEEILRLK